SDPGRDPRGHTITLAYALEAIGGRPKAGSDAAAIVLVNPDDPARMAFDHNEIVRKWRGLYSSARGLDQAFLAVPGIHPSRTNKRDTATSNPRPPALVMAPDSRKATAPKAEIRPTIPATPATIPAWVRAATPTQRIHAAVATT